MQLEQRMDGGILFLYLKGDLIGDQNNLEVLDAANLAIDQKVNFCSADLSNIRYMNSSGLGVLITLMTKFRNRGGELVLVNPSEQINKLLIITKLNSIFNVVKSEEEASQFFQNQISK
ncbi:MAG: STAS domain-containing protein [Cytophagaceae bacterium]|jgi:anti-sigma B factor antagonist|nr:STAS domain-containing protein [Cytophagaceae bacterium]